MAVVIIDSSSSIKNAKPRVHAPRAIVVHMQGGLGLPGIISALNLVQCGVHIWIGRNGETHLLMPWEKWSHHCGANFRLFSHESIGIELEGWGPLRINRDGTYSPINYNKLVPVEEVVSLEKDETMWDKVRLYHSVSDAQKLSLRGVIDELNRKYNYMFGRDIVQLWKPEVATNRSWHGICTHSSFNKYKSDLPFVGTGFKIL